MIIRVNVWVGLLSRTSRPIGRRMWPQHKTSRLNLILILSLSLWDYYPETAQKPVAMTTCSSSEHQWDEEPIIILPCYLSSQWVEYGGEICGAMFLCRGSLWGDWALARRERRRGDPGPCVSAHPAAVTRGSVPDSAWCLLGHASSALWMLRHPGPGPEPNTHRTSISPLWQEDVTKIKFLAKISNCHKTRPTVYDIRWQTKISLNRKIISIFPCYIS